MAAFASLDIGPKLSDTRNDHFAVFANTERNRVNRAGIDFAEAFIDLVLETLGLLVTEVELLQPRDGFGGTAGDGVEFALHAAGVGVVDQVWEVLLEKPHDREGRKRRDQRGTLLPDIFAILDRADDRRIRRRSTDLELCEALDQRCLGVARWWLGLVTFSGHAV